MAQNYTVNYTINVKSDEATKSLMSFQAAVEKLGSVPESLNKITANFNKLVNSLKKLSQEGFTVNIKTGKAEESLDRVITKLRTIRELTEKTGLITIHQTGAGSNNGSASSSSAYIAGSGGKNSSNQPTQSGRGGRSSQRSASGKRPPNWAYRALGPTMIDSGGIGAVDMLKGMGIAYGITGLGTLMGNVVRDASEYDNIIQTTKNILSVHDQRPNFAGRFSGMEQTIRNVGMETKFTAPEVANASKFLAMAGLNLDDINQSIRPIADVALIGDTDLGSTADMVTNIMTGYEIPAERMRNAVDVMTMTFTSANTDLTQLAEAYKYSASILHSGGVNFETATAALGILGNAGLQGSHGGTTMRMIMANLANPTKSQQKEWDRLGIDIHDSNGDIRPINQIFADLNAKGAGLKEMGRLFRITAAPGAVVLSQHINDWNEIIRRNYQAQGVSEELSDAKKNTIQGLWAQLTSAFTEDGLQAFESLQSQIRNFLGGIIEWLQTNDAKSYIKELGQTLMDLMKMFKDFTKTLLDVYRVFGPLIKEWLHFQLYVSTLLIPLRALKGVKQFGEYVFYGVRALGAFSNGVGSFISKIGVFLAVLRKGTFNPISAYNITNAYYARRGAAVGVGSAPVGGMLGGIGGIGRTLLGGGVGALAGNAIYSMAGGDNPSLSTFSTALGGLIGSGIMGAAASVPLAGWIALGGVGLGAVIVKAYELSQAWNNAKKAFTDYANSIKMENGVLSGDGLDTTSKYLELVYNKNLSITEVVQRRVDLLKEELGIQATHASQESGQNIDRKAMNKMLGNIQGVNTLLNNSFGSSYSSMTINGFSGKKTLVAMDHGSLEKGWYWRDPSGRYIKINNPKGWTDDKDAASAMAALYTEGLTGSEAIKIRNDYQNRLRGILMTGGSLNDILAVRKDWQKMYGTGYVNAGSRDTRPGAFAYGYGDLQDEQKWNGARIAASYPYRQGVHDLMAGIYGWNAPVWKSAMSYWRGVNSGKVTEKQVVDYISMMDVTIGRTLAKYSAATAQEWARNLGFVNGKFVSKNGLSSFEMAQGVKKQLDSLIEVLSMLPAPAQAASLNLLNLARYMNSMASGQVTLGQMGGSMPAGSGGSPVRGATKVVGNIKYRYNGVDWEAIYANGQRMYAIPNVSNANMSIMSLGQKKSSSGINFGGNHTGGSVKTGSGHRGGSGSTGPKASDYKNHYNTHNAAPKQVIVRIGNLMNVQSVDLTKKDNAEAINNLKGQLTQALVDVVHDFDETWNG